MKQKLLTFLWAVLAVGLAQAWGQTPDFSAVNADGVTLYYKLLDSGTEVAVYPKGDPSSSTSGNRYSAEAIHIPAKVSHPNGTSYDVVAIGYRAFYYGAVKEITLPASIRTIEGEAFRFCGVREMTLPEGLTAMNGERHFTNSTMLHTVHIPASLKHIPNYAFNDCSALATVTFAGMPESIGAQVFKGTALWRNSPDGLVTLMDGRILLGYKGSLEPNTTLTIPEGVEVMAESAFASDLPTKTNLTGVSFPSTLRMIPTGAFNGCGLYTLTIPEHIERIGLLAFANNSMLGTVNLNADSCYMVVNYNAGVFTGSNFIANLNIGDRVRHIPAGFAGTGIRQLTIPAGVQSMARSAFKGCKMLTSVTWDAADCLLDAGSGRTYPPFEGCTTLASVAFGEGVQAVPDYLFSGATSLASVTFPSGLTHIGLEAFYNTGFTSVTIPATLQEIGGGAFGNCSKLTSVTWNATNCAFTQSSRNGDTPFAESAITTVTLGDGVTAIPAHLFRELGTLTTVNWSDAVTQIGEQAFCSTGLQSVTIPAGVTEIGRNAFADCSALASVTWNAHYLPTDDPFNNSPFSTFIYNAPQVADAIGNPYFLSSHRDLTAVTIGEDVRRIPSRLFFDCESLQGPVNIPEEVEEVGYYAFRPTTLLTGKRFGITVSLDPTSCDTWADVYLYARVNADYTDYDLLGAMPGVKLEAPYTYTFPIPYGSCDVYEVAGGGTQTECHNDPVRLVFSDGAGNRTKEVETLEGGTFRLLSQSGTDISVGVSGGSSVPPAADKTVTLTDAGYEEAFDNTLGDFTVFDAARLSGSDAAIWQADGNGYAKASGYIGGNTPAESWLVSPAFDCTGVEYLSLYFEHALGYVNDVTDPAEFFALLVTTDGQTWTEVPITAWPAYGEGAKWWQFLNVRLDLTDYRSAQTRFAFRYTSTDAVAATWEVRNLSLTTTEMGESNWGASDGPFPSSHGYLYDVNGDGRMEYFVDNSPNVEQYSFDGTYLATIPTGHYLFALDDMDNDGVLDIICSQAGGANQEHGIYVHGLDGAVKSSFPGVIDSGTYMVMLDANSDGRQDFYIEERIRINGQHTPFQVIYYQQPDGSFVRQELTILDDPTEVDNALFGQYGANATVTQPINFSGVALAKSAGRDGSVPAGRVMRKTRSAELFYGNTSPVAVDVNLDGYPDLINLNNGDALLSVGDGRYYYGSFEGQTTVKDLNGDGMPDFILYDEESRIVTLFLYEGNNSFKKQTLMQNLNITGIYTYDFDHDGDVDILLPFDYTDSSQYAYLVFFENEGGNTFSKREQPFDQGRALSFIGGGDVDNDGKFEVVCREGNNIFLVDCEQTFNVGAQSEVIATVPDPKDYGYEGDYRFTIGDFNNDGLTEWWGGIDFDSHWSGTTPYSTREVGQFAAATPNTAPQQQGTPSYVYDPAVNMLRVEWPAGADAENSACDLTYALRIGTKPGLGDVWVAHADANGRRLRPGEGNAGYNTYALVSTAGWTKGTYYIAVQAVDANGLGGAWSDEVTFEYNGLVASFMASVDHMNIMDTLTLTTTLPYDAGLTYTWDFGSDGREVKREGNRWQVVFDRAGRKTLGLTLTDADGLMAVAEEQTVDVYPIAWEADSLTHDRVQYSDGLYLDLDGNGTLDLVGQSTVLVNGEVQDLKGVFENKENNNRFTKVGRIYNTDLDPSTNGYNLVPIDYNMDGKPDFMGTTNKGNLFVNLGSFDFDHSTVTYTLPPSDPYSASISEYDVHSLDQRIDFNNDGYLDVYYSYVIGMNQGDNRTFTKVEVLTNPEYQESSYQVCDFDRDGYVDMLKVEHDTYPTPTRTDQVLHRNRGDGTFERVLLYTEPWIRGGNEPTYRFFDLNNDGYPDMIWSIRPSLQGGVLETGSIHIVLGDASMNYAGKEEIVIDGYGMRDLPSEDNRLYDMDNNGWLDLPVTATDGFTTAVDGVTVHLQTADGTLYFYPNWETVFEREQSPSFTGDIKYGNNHPPFADLNGDGSPDGGDGYGGILMRTKHTNEAPAAPTNVRAMQQVSTVLLQWDAATDAETPAAHMRYNVSLKRKGATGADSYILSPLNEGSDVAAAIPGYPYRTATRMEVPASRFTVGEEYELRVQAIDLWNAHSPFSQTFTFRMESQVAIDAPAETCTEQPVTVTYQGTESGTPQWEAGEGGEVLEATGNTASMAWSTPGVKTVRVTVNGLSSERSIMVHATPDLALDLPASLLVGSVVYFTLPEAFADPSNQVGIYSPLYEGGTQPLPIGTYSSDTDPLQAHLLCWQLPIERKPGTREARLCVNEPGNHTLEVRYESEACGTLAETTPVEVLDIRPAISIVGVADGKNCVYWDAAGIDPMFDAVLVYREVGATDHFVQVGEAPVSDGQFIDPTSDPSVRKSRYCIALRTADGQVSGRSTVHGSVHVMLNQGLAPNSVNIVWTAYEGGVVNEYAILRGTSPDALEVLTTASGYETSFTDQARPEGDVYYAVQYDALYQPRAARKSKALRAAPTTVGRSNVVNANASATITLADAVSILVVESSGGLMPGQQELHLYAEILPAAATYKRVNWQIVSGSHLATLSDAGVLTYTGNGENGTVRVKATTIDGSACTATKDIPVDGFGGDTPSDVPVQSITLTAPTTSLSPSQPTVQLEVQVLPANATDKGYSWSIPSGSQVVEVSATGLVTATGVNGTATIRATAADGSGVYGEITLTASGFGGPSAQEAAPLLPTADVLVYSHDRTLVVKYAEGLALNLFDLSGRHLKHVDEALEEEVMDGIDPGLYLLYIEGHGSRKVVVK